jgi:hypothetical protein
MRNTRRHSGKGALLFAACCALALPIFSSSTTLAEEQKPRKKKSHSSEAVAARPHASRYNQEERYGYGQRHSARPVTSTWSTDTPATHAYVRQDAYGTSRRDGDKQFITGSLIKQDVTVNGNSADTASPVSVYGQQDLRAHGGGVSAADSLRRIDPSIQVSGR